MNKSHLSKASSSRPVVTPHDIGSFVKVASVGTGILRYVGPIHGKEGLFCGIELDSGEGKHDGSYQGVSYFKCPPARGIFAPMYKVELDEPEDIPMMSVSQMKKGEERLSRSALPSLALKNVFRPEERELSSSIMSDTSMNMDSSLFSQGSWRDAEMYTSNTTYVIPPGRSHLEQDDEDLMTIEAPKPIVRIDRDALKREEERLLATSYVVEESKIGIHRLPIVEDEDEDLATPLVEVLPPPEPIAIIPQLETVHDQPSPTTPKSEEIISIETKMDTNKKEDEHENMATIASTPTSSAAPSIAEEKRPKKSKKEMEPAAPKFPVKPKAPSKHQLMMEQLKASIEADKNKPKKEVKARVPLLPPPPQPKEKMEEKPKKQPLKTLNPPPPKPASERPKKERQPLYVPPPPKEKKEPPAKPAPKEKEKPAMEPKRSPRPSSVSKEPSQKSHFPTSSFAGGKQAKVNGTTATSKTSVKKKIIGILADPFSEETKHLDDHERLARLHRAVQLLDVLSVVFGQSERSRESTEKNLHENREKLAIQQKTSDDLRLALSQKEKQLEVEREQMKTCQENRKQSLFSPLE